MSDNGLPTITERVEKGIAWLEEQGAYNWAEKIVAAVDDDTFRIWSGCSCAVGVTLGEYSVVMRQREALDDGERLGFNAPYDLDDEDAYDRELNALEAEWERQARARLAWETSP